jgi:hypothetical protein
VTQVLVHSISLETRALTGSVVCDRSGSESRLTRVRQFQESREPARRCPRSLDGYHAGTGTTAGKPKR